MIETIQYLVDVVNRKLLHTTIAAENIATKSLGMIDYVIEKTRAFLELEHFGDSIEASLIPLFEHLKKPQLHDLDNEIIDILNNLMARRKSNHISSRNNQH